MSRLNRFFTKHRIAIVGFALAVILLGFFLVKIVLDMLFWNDPAHRRVDPAAWMTPGFIAHSWHVDGRDLAFAIGITEKPEGRPTLEEIAEMRGVPVAQVIAEVQAFLAENAR